MSFDHKKIVLRALNSYDLNSPITGLGIKCILDQMQNNRVNSLLPAILKRKFEVSKQLTFKKYKVLKEVDNGVNKYRLMVIPSPFSALIEAYCFTEMSNSDTLKNSKSVYSYRMPEKGVNSPRNFEYYYKNYTAMNLNIAQTLTKKHGDTVVIIDLKRFYPSINTKLALKGLSDILPKYRIIEGTFKAFTEGLPIGLDLSHVIAQQYLAEFDIHMQGIFNNRYFRYVDDISIVCNHDEVQLVVDQVKKHLPKGLLINENKLDLVTKADWINHAEQFEQRSRLDNFSATVCLYFLFNPKFELVKDKLIDKGYRIPFHKFEKRIKTSTFKRYFNILFKQRLSLVSSVFRWSENDFMNYLLNRKKYHLEEIYNSFNEIKLFQNPKDIKTRFCVQNTKFHAGNLFYLLNDVELLQLKADLPNHDSLAYVGSIITALLANNFDQLIVHGGRSVVILSELWLAKSITPVEISFVNFNDLTDFTESIVFLKLANVINFDLTAVRNKLSAEDEYNFMAAILGAEFNYDGASDYVKELHCIFSIYNESQLSELLFSKFDKTDENTVFAALENGLY